MSLNVAPLYPISRISSVLKTFFCARVLRLESRGTKFNPVFTISTARAKAAFAFQLSAFARKLRLKKYFVQDLVETP